MNEYYFSKYFTEGTRFNDYSLDDYKELLYASGRTVLHISPDKMRAVSDGLSIRLEVYSKKIHSYYIRKSFMSKIALHSGLPINFFFKFSSNTITHMINDIIMRSIRGKVSLTVAGEHVLSFYIGEPVETEISFLGELKTTPHALISGNDYFILADVSKNPTAFSNLRSPDSESNKLLLFSPSGLITKTTLIKIIDNNIRLGLWCPARSASFLPNSSSHPLDSQVSEKSEQYKLMRSIFKNWELKKFKKMRKIQLTEYLDINQLPLEKQIPLTLLEGILHLQDLSHPNKSERI